MSGTWTLTITAPCGWINANQREHWRVKAEKTKLWREAARTWARSERLPTGLDCVHIDALLHFRDSRRRDAHNYMPTLKAIVDGIVDHGLIPDDTTLHLSGPDIRVGDPRPTRVSYAPAGFVTLLIRVQLDPGRTLCPVCGIAVTVLVDGRLNGHGWHGKACDGSWAVVGVSS